MGLTPSIKDENRKAEMKRMEKEPGAFGIVANDKRPKDWSPTGLKNDIIAKTKAAKKPTKAEIIATFPELTMEELQEYADGDVKGLAKAAADEINRRAKLAGQN